MKKTKKLVKSAVTMVLGVALMAGSLTGCSGGGDTKETQAQNTEGQTTAAGTEKIQLVCWRRSAVAEDQFTKTIDEFNASQDRIHVSSLAYGDNYAEVLKLAFNSGDEPDFFDVASLNDMKSYAEAGLVAPLDEFLTDEFKSKFNPSAFVQYNYDGSVYAIPEMTRFVRVYYNKDVFEKAGLDPETPPATLEEMYQYAKQITEAGKGEYYGFGLPIKSGSTWERNVDDIAILSGLTGPCGFDYTTGKFDFSKQKPVLEYYAKMYQDGILMPGSESIDIEMLRANFVAGKIGMYFDGNWMVNGYNNEIEGGSDFNWETALVPVFEDTKRAKDYLMLDSGRAISASCENKEAAFEAISYVLSNLYSAPIRKNPENAMPSFSLIEADNEAINSNEAVQALMGMKGMTEGVEQLSSFAVTPHSLLTLEGENRNSVYPLLIIQGNTMDIDKELNKLSETYNKALEQAVKEGLVTEDELKPAGFDYYTR